MKSVLTSYAGMFAPRSGNESAVERVEIPLFQRDYAQGREGASVRRIRDEFLEVLFQAVTGGPEVCLDFVYGRVDGGTLRPLDGQQRLTTLFLLHWYISARAGRLADAHGWKRFTYATRPSAESFCGRLVAHAPDPGCERLSKWIVDQPWFRYTWRHDPTIQSMLTMLDAIHGRFGAMDATAAWERLTDNRVVPVSFNLLATDQLGASEDLYIRMNSRGRPLTDFESFKARFEQVLVESCADRVGEFSLKVDGAWSDLLWRYCGDDYSIDDEFQRYFSFVTEICEWRDGRVEEGELGPRAERTFGTGNPKAKEYLAFLFRAFDTWCDTDVPVAFGKLFATSSLSPDAARSGRVMLHGVLGSLGANLFGACCQNYGTRRGRNARVFNLQHTLLLYAVLIHRVLGTSDFERRLRVLRNLIEASENELRREEMPGFIQEVERLVVSGRLDGFTRFNTAQLEDERLKARVITRTPGIESVLFRLEDHEVLRGSVAAFDLNEAALEGRASAFEKLFSGEGLLPSLTGALLSRGDYSRRHANGRSFQFGSSSLLGRWRELLTGAGREELKTTREVLERLLDDVNQHGGDLGGSLEAIQKRWLESQERQRAFDWRYYFVKYPAMREGRSGRYVGLNGAMGFSTCMLNKTYLNSWYRDPFLLAIYRESDVGDAVEDPWFTGYETLERWMQFVKSSVAVRCVQEGFAIRSPQEASQMATFSKVCERHGVDQDGFIWVPQTEREGHFVDTRDRVQLGAALVRDLADAGL